MTRKRKLDITHCFVLVTEGRIPTDLGKLLGAMRERIGDVSEAEVREAIRWALRPSSLPFPHPKAPHQRSKRLQAVT